MTRHHYISLLATASLLVPALRAEQAFVEFDPARTKVHFSLDSVLHTVHGTFNLKRGVIRFDTASGDATGELIVDATSGESGNESRDRRMHKSILESAQFTEVKFVPRRVEGQIAPEGESSVLVHGIMTLHGKGHEFTLPATVRRDTAGLAVRSSFSIPYIAWELKNPSTFLLRVSDKVNIQIEGDAQLAK
jgi:polyisoprenoid-binding protein YceI